MKGFPFQYTGEMVFYHSGNLDLTDINQKIWAAFGHENNDKNTATVRQGPFILSSSVTIELKPDPIVLHIIYHINLMPTNALAIIGFLFSFLLLSFNYYHSAFIALCLSVSGYLTMFILQYGYVERIIAQSIDLPPFEGEAALWHKQQQWLKQAGVCPACGETRNIYSDKCTSCGLKLPPVSGQKGIDNNSSTTTEIDYNYELKK